jgi:probable F420-dependent oxidoreductase
MKLGFTFPQDRTMDDPSAIRDLAQAAEGLGFEYITITDHVLGPDLENRPKISDVYSFSYKSIVREALVLMGFLAGCTKSITLNTSVLVLPQRPAALVAKQLAEIDVLSGGRAVLGVGIGWNPVEFEALNEDFHNRGRRMEEQIAVMRALWTQDVVDFTGEWHRIDRAGINPRPIQQPIPIWIGSGAVEAPMRRAARLADGWIPPTLSPAETAPMLEQFRGYLNDAGRDPSTVSIAGRIILDAVSPEDWAAEYAAWQALDVSHLVISTRRPGVENVDGHIGALREFLATIR